MNVIRKNTFQNRKQHRLELSSNIVSRESEYTENRNVYKQCLFKKIYKIIGTYFNKWFKLPNTLCSCKCTLLFTILTMLTVGYFCRLLIGLWSVKQPCPPVITWGTRLKSVPLTRTLPRCWCLKSSFSAFFLLLLIGIPLREVPYYPSDVFKNKPAWQLLWLSLVTRNTI